jgi:transposase
MECYLGKEVVAMFNLHRQFVSTHVFLFNEGGLEKLLDKKTPLGKSPYLTEEQQGELKHMILHSNPFEQGLGVAASWDPRIIQSYLQDRYGISMKRVRVNKMLHRLGLSYTRPTYTLAKGDEQKQRAIVQEMDMIKKLMTDDMVLLYTDETHIRSYQALRATWAKVRKQKQIPTYGHHASVRLFGVVNVLNGKVITQPALACNTESFLEFVKRI